MNDETQTAGALGSTEGLGPGTGARKRVRTVDRDSQGWITRNAHTGAIYPTEDFRWNTRAGAWHAAWEARVLNKGKATQPNEVTS